MSRPRCVLVPGMLCDAEVFRAQIVALTGHYDTTVLLPEGTVDEAVDAIVMSQSTPFALIGFSLGGIVAAACAIRSPELITDLVLIATNPTAPRPEQREQWREWRSLVSHGSFERASNEATEAMLVGTGDPAQWQVADRMARRVGPDGFDRQLTVQESRIDLRPELHRIRARTLLAVGGSDPLCPLPYLQMIQDRVPNSTLRVYEDGGHLIPFARAEEFSDDLLGFLLASR